VLIHKLLPRAARRDPDRPALIADEGALTFAELDAQSDAVAARLGDMGLARGARVALLLDNSPEFVVALFAALKAGGVIVPLNPTVKSDKLAHLIDDAGASVLFTRTRLIDVVSGALERTVSGTRVVWVDGEPPDAAVAPAADWHPPRPEPAIDEDLAAILYTSGSTGEPKGVMLTHRTICNNAWAIGAYLRNEPDDVVLCVLPLSFSYGLFQVLTAVEVGYTVALERSFAYPLDTLRRIGALRVTGLPGVPSVFATLLQHVPSPDVDLSSLRFVTNAGSGLPPAHLDRLRAALPGVDIFCMYGQTECTRAAYLDPAMLDAKRGSVGRAIPNSEVYLVDDDGKRLPPGATGELVVRGANVMRGYWRKPAETADRLRPGENEGERVLHTGDLFHMDEDGYLTFVARRDDVFKSKGEKVSPREIEAVLHELEGVVEAAVVGVAHPIDGLAVKAFVVLLPGAELDAREIRRHCRARLESHLVPRFVELRDELPKTDSGKINKTTLV
jgi:amino acid adenylation domain-containing protein